MAIISVILLILFVIICLALVFIVAVQDENSTGLSGIFGGGSDSAFGGQTNKVMNKLTTILLVSFFVLAILVALVNKTPKESLVAPAAPVSVSAPVEGEAAPEVPAVVTSQS